MNIFNRLFKVKNTPKIIIKHGRLIDPVFIFYCQNNKDFKERGWNNWEPPEKAELKKRISAYKEAWGKYEKEILEGICNILNLRFKRRIIEVYIVSGNPRQMSDPLIIKSGFKPDEFVDVLTHELIHKLFEHNGKKFPFSILEEMFPGETNTVRNHVITFAVLKYIYLDILKDKKRLERHLENSNKHRTSDYSKAWQIVEEKGYIKLIEKLKSKIK